MEIKIISQSGERIRIVSRHIVEALESGNRIENYGYSLEVQGNRYEVAVDGIVVEKGILARKVWKVWATTGHESAVQPIATFNTLEEAYSAATQEEIHPVCHITVWHHERGWEKLSPSKNPSGFFVQETWV